MSTWETLLQAAKRERHLVQLYESDERLLARNVSQYLLDGLRQGDGLLVIATTPRFVSFLTHIKKAGADPDDALRAGQLVFLEADDALARFMGRGRADGARFESSIGNVIWDIRARRGSAGLRVFGDLAGILWKSGQFSAAIRVEQLWNDLVSSIGFHLFCAYPIDVFSDQFQTAAVNPLLRIHTHLLPVAEDGALEGAVDLAMHEVLGPETARWKREMDVNSRPSWGVVPKAEAMVLWIRDNLPERAQAILGRARQYYVTSHWRPPKNNSEVKPLAEARGSA